VTAGRQAAQKLAPTPSGDHGANWVPSSLGQWLLIWCAHAYMWVCVKTTELEQSLMGPNCRNVLHLMTALLMFRNYSVFHLHKMFPLPLKCCLVNVLKFQLL